MQIRVCYLQKVSVLCSYPPLVVPAEMFMKNMSSFYFLKSGLPHVIFQCNVYFFNIVKNFKIFSSWLFFFPLHTMWCRECLAPVVSSLSLFNLKIHTRRLLEKSRIFLQIWKLWTGILLKELNIKRCSYFWNFAGGREI